MDMLIGLHGWQGAGKDTVADILVRDHGFTRLAFADSLRSALLALNPVLGCTPEPGPWQNRPVRLATFVEQLGWDEAKRHFWYGQEVRELLQRMGTEVGRAQFGENFWVDRTMAQARQHERVVITDVRFENEAEAVASVGYLWNVVRPGHGKREEHASERDLSRLCHFTAHNDHGLGHLEDEVFFLVNLLKRAAVA